MFEIILACVVSASLPLGAYIGYQKYWPNKNKFPKISNPKANVDPQTGISIVDFSNKQETEEEYLKKLQVIHSKAWKEYCEYNNRPMAYDADRYVNLLLLKAANGLIKFKIGKYTLDFDEADEVWIGNAYYSFGNLYRSKKRPELIYDGTSKRLSPYTFLRLVDFLKEHQEPCEWRREHDSYCRRSYYNKLKDKF